MSWRTRLSTASKMTLSHGPRFGRDRTLVHHMVLGDPGPNRQRDDDLRIQLACHLFSDMRTAMRDVVLHRKMLKMLLDAACGNDRCLKADRPPALRGTRAG